MTNETTSRLAMPGEYLSFRLDKEEYGIPILTVQEIRGYQEPTRIANSPPAIKGVVNLRGVIVPIVDLRLQLGLDQAEYNEITATIVLNLGQRVVGIVVDSVSDVVALNATQIKEPPQMTSGIDTAYVTGIATQEDSSGNNQRMLILVAIDRLIAESALAVADVSLSY